MAEKPSYEELEQRIIELENGSLRRKKAEKQSQLEYSRLMGILDSIPDGVYIVDQHFNIEYINPVIERDFGKIQGRKCYQYFHDRAESCLWCKNEEVFAGRSVNWEWYSVKNDRHYELFDTPFQNPDGSISKFEIFHDITDRKQAEAALQESEEHHRSFVESAKGFIVYRLEVDIENYFSGRLVFVSPSIEDEIGISPEAEFSEWFNNVHPDDLPGLIEAQAKSVLNGDTFDHEFRWKDIKGEWGWGHAISNPVFDSDGNPAYYNGIVVNLTSQKQAEKLRLVSSRLLKAQERERKRISLELHDELGQSLLALKLQLSSIERRLEEGQTELRSECQSMLGHIGGLIGHIRRICKDLSPVILDDLGLTAGIRWLVKNVLKSHDIDTSMNIANIDRLLTNEQQLLVFRIFQEAFTNIVRHSLASLTSIIIKRQGEAISLVIEDNGKGFDVKKAMDRDFIERGMGLSGMKERAWMLGGSVNIWSQSELGTRIEFKFPIDQEIGSF